MADANIGIGITAQTSGLAKGLVQAQGMIDHFGKAGTAAIFALQGAFDLVTSAASGFMSVVDRVDQIGDTASNIGIAVDELTQLQGAALLAGSDAGAMTSALEKMTTNLGKAGEDSEKAAARFTELGLSAEALRDMSPEDALAAISDKIKDVGTVAEQRAASVDIFGKSAGSLTNMLASGSEGIKGYRDEVVRLGGNISDVDAQNLGNVQTAFDKFSLVLDGVYTKISAALAPIVTYFSDQLLNSGDIGKKIADWIVWGMEQIAKGIAYASNGVDIMYGTWMSLRGGVEYAIGGIMKALAWLAQGLEDILNMIPGVEVTFGTSLNNMADAVLKLADEDLAKAGKALDDAFSNKRGKDVEKFFNGIREANKKTQAEIDKTKDAAKKIIDPNLKAGGVTGPNKEELKRLEDLNKSYESYVSKLQDSIKYHGMESDQIEIAKFAAQGLAEEELEATRQLIAQKKLLDEKTKAIEAQKKLEEEKAEKVKKYLEEARTPLEEIQDKFKDIADLQFNPAQFEKVKNKLVAEYANSLPDIKLGGAVDANSVEGRSMILQNKFANKLDKNRIAEKHLNETVKQTELLQIMVQNPVGVEVLKI